MKPIELKVARIGNSRGVRIPASTLERYHVGETLVMEERVEGILLRPHGHVDTKLSWEETARDMGAHAEDWTEWEALAADGLDEITWEPRSSRRVAERSPEYGVGAKPSKRSGTKKR